MTLNLISTRRNNKIFEDDNNTYKVFNEGYSKNDVFIEAFITARVEDLGVSVPSIQAVSLIDGMWAFQSPSIEGKTLFQLMNENPSNMDKYLDQFVEIQTSIHKYKCPLIPVQKQKLTGYINQADLDEDLKIDLIDMLNSAPKHNKLCHGNLTPYNIIINDSGYCITDWNHASQGNSSADIARTYLWMKLNMANIAEDYLNKFCEKTNTSSKYVHNWIPIVAAARIAKGNPEEVDLLRNSISIVEY